MLENITQILSNPFIYYWLVALTFSLFYGFKAVRIFMSIKALEEDVPKKSQSWHIHQFWLNFSGSGVGWIILYFLVRNFLNLEQKDLFSEFNAGHIGLAFLAFVGITGYMPTTIITLVNSISLLIQKVADILANNSK